MIREEASLEPDFIEALHGLQNDFQALVDGIAESKDIEEEAQLDQARIVVAK